MEEQEWMKFENTGRITDYLTYKEHSCGFYTQELMSVAGQAETGRSVTGHGADHSADGHGIISRPSGRI